MEKSYSEIYKDVAEKISEVYFVDNKRLTKLQDIFNYLCDITEVSDFNKVDILNFLLQEVNEVYRIFRLYGFNKSIFVGFVSTYNEYTKCNFGDISLFVNNIWDDSVPAEWAELSQMAGYKIDNWNIETSS